LPLTLPLALPLTDPVVPEAALERSFEVSVELLELLVAGPLSRCGAVMLRSVELELDEAGGLLAPEDEEAEPWFSGGLTVVEDDELDAGGWFAGGTTVVDDEDDAPGRADDPVLLLRLSPHALSAAATAVTTTSFAKVRKVLSIY